MKDAETMGGARDLPPPRHDSRGGRPVHMQHQPKPKFVSHKPEHQGKKGKDKVSSNRLGDSHMA